MLAIKELQLQISEAVLSEVGYMISLSLTFHTLKAKTTAESLGLSQQQKNARITRSRNLYSKDQT